MVVTPVAVGTGALLRRLAGCWQAVQLVTMASVVKSGVYVPTTLRVTTCPDHVTVRLAGPDLPVIKVNHTI